MIGALNQHYTAPKNSPEEIEMHIFPWQGLAYRQVDVFARDVLNGNGVAVFWNTGEIPTETMQELTRELR